MPSVISSVDVEAVSAGIEWAGIEWDQLPVPCAPDIHEQVGRRGHGIRAPLRNLMHAVEQGHGPTTENSAWAPEHIGDDSPDARAHLRHEQTNKETALDGRSSIAQKAFMERYANSQVVWQKSEFMFT